MAGRRMDGAVLSRVADAVMRLADRAVAFLDSEEERERQDADQRITVQEQEQVVAEAKEMYSKAPGKKDHYLRELKKEEAKLERLKSRSDAAKPGPHNSRELGYGLPSPFNPDNSKSRANPIKKREIVTVAPKNQFPMAHTTHLLQNKYGDADGISKADYFSEQKKNLAELAAGKITSREYDQKMAALDKQRSRAGMLSWNDSDVATAAELMADLKAKRITLAEFGERMNAVGTKAKKDADEAESAGPDVDKIRATKERDTARREAQRRVIDLESRAEAMAAEEGVALREELAAAKEALSTLESPEGTVDDKAKKDKNK